MLKSRPHLNLTPNDGYAQIVAAGFDTFVEVYKCMIPDELKQRLEKSRDEAAERDGGKAEGLTIEFGGQEFQIHPYRAKGKAWILKNENFIIEFMYTEWNIMVRFNPPVLWELGIEKARENLLSILFQEVRPMGDDWSRISQAHYAFDYHAPDFQAEMRPQILDSFVCTSGVKKRAMGKLNIDYDYWMQGARGETVTIGTKKNLQIQVYNKTNEIREFSGKWWMVDLWEKGGLVVADKENPPTIWRLEVRFGKEYLKNRDGDSIRRFECFLPYINELICDALERRRLTRPNYSDKNKARWPVHEFWTAAIEYCDNPPERLTLQRRIEKTRDEMHTMFKKGVGGNVRSVITMLLDEYSREDAEKFLRDVLDDVEHDPEHEIKIVRARERYKFIDHSK